MQSATLFGQNAFLTKDETLDSLKPRAAGAVAVYGAQGTETLTLLDTANTLTLDANIEHLELPKAYSDYQIKVNGTRVTISEGNTTPVTLKGLNQPIKVLFTDREATLTLNGLNQLDETFPDQFSVQEAFQGLTSTLLLSINSDETHP